MAQTYRSQHGFTAMAMAGILVGIIVLWFIFTFILDMIGNRHKAKVQKRMEHWAERSNPKAEDNAPREVKGYTLSF